MTQTKMTVPLDGRQNPINRAMGLPIPKDEILLGSDQKYVDIYDLSAQNYSPRAFTGMSVVNPSGVSKIYIAMGGDFSENKVLIVSPQQFFTIDNLSYGPGIFDDSSGLRVTKIRAKLEISEGVFASATIDYSGSGNPVDGMTFDINGKIYEFSADMSKDPGNNVLVPISGSGDATWTTFMTKVNASEQAVTATIDTGLDIVTITSNYGGAYGDGLVVADGAVPSGAVVSGNLAGGSGGLNPIFHIW